MRRLKRLIDFADVESAQLRFANKILKAHIRDAYAYATGRAPLNQRGGNRPDGTPRWDSEKERERMRKDILGWLGTEDEAKLCERLGYDPIEYELLVVSILKGTANLQTVEQLLKHEDGEERNYGKKRKEQWRDATASGAEPSGQCWRCKRRAKRGRIYCHIHIRGN